MGLRAAVRPRLTAGWRGVLSIASGAVGGQLLLLLAAPVLARMYGPAEFGVFTVVATLVTTLGTVAALRYELAVPLPRHDRGAHELVLVGLVCALATAVLGTAVIAVAGDAVAAAFGQPVLRTWLWLVPWTAGAMGSLLVLNQWAVRHRRYGAIGRRTFLQSVTMLSTQLVAGGVGLRSGGLALGLGVGHLAGALVLLPGARLGGAPARAARHPRRLWRTARRYRRFPLLLAPAGLLNVLGLQLPVLLIAYWYGSTAAGWLGLTQRVLAAPAALVGAAVAQVYLGELCRVTRADPGRARRIFLGASWRLALVAAPGAALTIVVAPTLFSVLFTDQWATSGVYARALAIGTAAHLVAAPLSQTLVVLGRPGLQLAWDVGRLLLVTGAVGGTALAGGSALVAVWSFGLASAVAYGASWLMSLRALAHPGGPTRPVRPDDPRELVRQAGPAERTMA